MFKKKKKFVYIVSLHARPRIRENVIVHRLLECPACEPDPVSCEPGQVSPPCCLPGQKPGM